MPMGGANWCRLILHATGIAPVQTLDDTNVDWQTACINDLVLELKH